MVNAVDDNIWKTGANETMWQNARYLTWNDQGSGTLKVTSVASKSAAGGTISFSPDGTIQYKPAAGFQGKDSVQYTVTDSTGSSDTAVFHVQVGSGTSGTGGSTSGGSALAPIKIMAMGDSNTYGVNGYNNKESGGYRLHLDQKLKAAGLSFDMVGSLRNGHAGFDRDHEGYNGIQSDGLTAKIPGIMSAGKPDVILLMSGSNDAKTDSVAKMGADMKQLLDTIKAHAPDTLVLVAGAPPSREGNTAGISPTKIAQYNADLPGIVAAKKAAGMKVAYVDTSSMTVNDISSIGEDSGVHLNQAGSQKLAGIWFDALKSLGVKDGTIDAGRSGSGSGPVVIDRPADEVPSGGTGNPVTAVDDDMWKTGKDQTMWQNARYLTWNDKGGSGELKVTAVAAKSAAGANVSFASDGTITYKPVAGWQGKDWVDYTVRDAAGNTDAGKFYVQVGTGTGTPAPAPAPAPAPNLPGTPPPGGGGGVTAVDDDFWATAKDGTMWQAARYLTWNDKGSGDLKVTAVAAKSAAGGSIDFSSDGTIKFKPLAGWQGKDAIAYTVADAAGNTDTGTFYVQVGSGGPKMSPIVDAPSPVGGGNPVIAKDDHWNAKSGEKLWFNSRYLLTNDKAEDGGLAVKSIAAATAKGGTITWDVETGTTVYRSKAGFVGKDWAEYTAVDADGSIGTALINFDVLIA